MKKNLILSLLAVTALSAGAQSQGYKDGIEYYKAAQYDNAKTILNNTLNQSETDKALAYYYLGQIDLAQDNKQGAQANFEKVKPPTRTALTTTWDSVHLTCSTAILRQQTTTSRKPSLSQRKTTN